MPFACPLYLFWISAGEYKDAEGNKLINCAPMSEQINSHLRKLESHVSYMRQTTFLRYLRNFLYLRNESIVVDG